MFNIKTLIEKVINRSNTAPETKDVTEELIDSSVRVILNKEKCECLSADKAEELKNVFKNEDEHKYAFAAFCFGRYVSDNLFESLHYLVKAGYRALIYTNSSDCTKLVQSKIDQFKKYGNAVIVEVSDNQSHADLMLKAAECLRSEYVAFYTFTDKINARSFINRIDAVISKNDGRDVYVSSEYFNVAGESFHAGSIFQDWSLSGISGVVFRKSFLTDSLKDADTNKNLWLLNRILSDVAKEKVCVHEEQYLFNKIPSCEITLKDIAVVAKETIQELESVNYGSDGADIILGRFNLIVRDLFRCNIDVLKKALIFTSVCYVFYLCEIHKLEVEKWKQIFCRSLDFCHKLTYKDVYGMICRILPVLVEENQTDLFIVENPAMPDIGRSRFFELISEKYSVDYQLKRSYVDYYRLNNLILKMHSRAARLTLSSVSLCRDMYYYPNRHITLWHGLGWLKKTVFTPQNYSVGTIICSSRACEDGYKEHFHADKAIGLGCVQTDRLYDEDFINSSREKVRQKYGIPNDGKVIFFAPTFRMGGKRHYYNFGIDIDELAEKLKEHNLYVITKRHHIFQEDFRDFGIDESGVHDSQNGHFIVDSSFDFTELMSSCDCFVTDYSSSMYFAFILKLPIFLYATDIDEYKKGPNGFEIDYPNDIPLPLVDKPDADEFINGYYRSLSVPQTQAYLEYRKYNVQECDGKVAERVMDYISSMI